MAHIGHPRPDSGLGFQVTVLNTVHVVPSPLGGGMEMQHNRKVDVRLPGKRNSTSHGARPVHLIITMIKWIRTSRLSINNSLCNTTVKAASMGISICLRGRVRDRRHRPRMLHLHSAPRQLWATPRQLWNRPRVSAATPARCRREASRGYESRLTTMSRGSQL